MIYLQCFDTVDRQWSVKVLPLEVLKVYIWE